MEVYFKAFINEKQNNQARLLPIAEFAYNNAKNTKTGHISFKLNCRFYPQVLFEKDVTFYSRSYSADKLADKLRELIETCYQNLPYIQELQKRVHDKRLKSRSYTPKEIVWLNSKYIKMEQNKKLENKFFRSFQVFYVVEKQIYKLELSTK